MDVFIQKFTSAEQCQEIFLLTKGIGRDTCAAQTRLNVMLKRHPKGEENDPLVR